MELIVVVLLIVLALYCEVRMYEKHGIQDIHYQCGFDKSSCTEGDMLIFREQVENRGNFPIAWIKAELTLPRWLDFSEKHSVISDDVRFVTSFFSVRGKARVNREWQVTCEKRGVYQVEHVVLVTADLLGAIRLSLQAEETGGVLTVFPACYEGEKDFLEGFFWRNYGEEAVRQSVYRDAVTTVGLRLYQIGDNLKQMHWKASAHRGSYMMREMEQIACRTITIFMQFNTIPRGSGKMVQEEDLLEHTIRVCNTCLKEALQDGWNVRLITANEAYFESPYLQGRAGWEQMQYFLAGLNSAQFCVDILKEMPNFILGERVVLITPFTDEKVVDWKRQTNGMVIVTGHHRDYGTCGDKMISMQEG